jgi:diguanylate cyclase (GGDEF)-like protein
MALSFTKVRLQAALVATLCIGTGALAGYLLLVDLGAALQRADNAREAAEAARRIDALFHAQQHRLAGEAAKPETIQALASGTRADRARRAAELRAGVPDAIAAVLIARAESETAAAPGHNCPTLGRPTLAAAVTFAGAPTGRQYSVIQAVHDEQQRLLGHVLLCFSTDLVAQHLGTPGYAELRQANGAAQRIVVATGKRHDAAGAAVFTSLGPPGLVLAYWSATRSAWRPDRYFYVAVVALAILGLLVTAYAFHRATARAVQHDIKSLALMSQDVRAGQLREDYPVELREFADVFQALRDFGHRTAEEKNKLKELGLIDHLSQLSNRRHFEMRLTDLFELSRTRPRSSVLILDIDRFKEVNDRLGHEAGDALIIGIAQALRRLVRHTDILARLGGDEFCIIYACTALDRALTLVHRLRAQLPSHVRLGRGINYPLRWSGGMSVMLPTDTRSHDVLWRADQALIEAKHRGGGMTLPYSPAPGTRPASETPVP